MTLLRKNKSKERNNPADLWTADAIEKKSFRAYQLAIMHDWLRTLILMAAGLVPLFFILDIIMMPSNLLPRFAIYRSISTVLALIQVVIVRKTNPTKFSYIHGYFVSLQVGCIIAMMTTDLGGFNSSYYAGLNLVIIGVNLLMPWQAYHTAANSLLIIFMYVTFNLLSAKTYSSSIVMNNLFFIGATSVLSAAINFVRFKLIHREFNLLVDLGKTRDALIEEKEIVEGKTRSLQGLLDVSGQGFLTFDDKFIIGNEYSLECENIFGKDIENSRIDDLLYSDHEAKTDFIEGMNLFFNGISKSEVIFDLMDNVLEVGKRIIMIDYKEIHHDQVMLALTDITIERERQEISREENEKWNMILKVISNKHAFVSFNHEARELITALINNNDKIEAYVLDLHTFKSNAGFLGFNKTQSAAHELEDFISDRITLGEDIKADKGISQLSESFNEELALVTDSLGKEWRLDTESIEISLSEYLEIEDHVKSHCPNPHILNVLEEHRKKPLSELFTRFPQMAEDLAKRMGKKIMPIHITGGNLLVNGDDFEELIDTFSHLIRNIIDHGIEMPFERKAKGKHEAGLIEIDIKQQNDKTYFTFLDDGKGITLSKVEMKAKELGLIKKDETATISKLLTLIFQQNLSTADIVTEISGRGVGLPAVREAVRRMNGIIKVKTTRDRGTVFTIEVPTPQYKR